MFGDPVFKGLFINSQIVILGPHKFITDIDKLIHNNGCLVFRYCPAGHEAYTMPVKI